MTNGNQLTREEQAWLTEYQVCQQAINSNVQSYWTLSGIFIGLTSALLAGLVLGVLSNSELLRVLLDATHGRKEFLIVGIVAWVISMAVLVVLYFLKGWLNRTNFISRLNFERMREIEVRLNMQINLIAKGIEHWHELKSEVTRERELINPEKREPNQIENLQNKLKRIYTTLKEDEVKYERPSGKWHHKWIFRTLFGLWLLILIGSLLSLFFHSYAAITVLIVITAVIWLIILTRKSELPTDFLKE